MKKVAVFGLALAMAFSVNAQDSELSAGGPGTGTIGGIATGSLVAGVVATGVIVGIVANNRSDSAPVDVTPPVKLPTCNGTDPLVNNVCTGTNNVVTVTGTGTNTTTISVPVTFTYAPTVK